MNNFKRIMSYNNIDIVIATTNPGKVREIKECLGNRYRLHNLNEYKSIVEVKEDGKTFEENARKKALYYSKNTGKYVIADDSGLVIDALNGAPGINSARFSGDKQKGVERTLIDHRNIKKVLKMMKNIPEEQRTARFVCSMCFSSPEKVLLNTQEELEGFITDREIGDNGFGYDPILYIPEMKKTVAQLSPEQKNAISHRGKAIRKMKILIEEFFNQPENKIGNN